MRRKFGNPRALLRLDCGPGTSRSGVAPAHRRQIAPGGSSIAYASSKAGLNHLTHCLAVALAPDATVNCIAPGLVEGTRMAERVPEDMKRIARMQAVLGRTGSVEDIAEQALAFCRTETVTGQVLVVDGGMPAGMR
jgi:3-oxoacyl-[acyl-carrier protein] reductase